MEKLLEQLTFMCGSIGACLLILTIYFCCRGVFKLIDDCNSVSLRNDNDRLKEKCCRLQSKVEMYERQEMLKHLGGKSE